MTVDGYKRRLRTAPWSEQVQKAAANGIDADVKKDEEIVEVVEVAH